MALQEWRILELSKINEPGACEFRTGDGDWPFRGFIVRWEGQVYAYANSCAHLGHPLNMEPDKFFTADRRLLLCGSHGALFEPDTGICTAGPCAGARLARLACRLEDGWVYVRAPDSMRAGSAATPD
jgi:nitrite reductase/ring-hydroxylating ferredoxin subunit